MQSSRHSRGDAAERAATRALALALLSVLVALLTLWLLNFFGQMALGIGLLVWLVAWVGSVVFGIAALRGAPQSAGPVRVRRRAITGLAIDGIILALMCLFFIGLIRAIQQLT